MAVSLHAGKSLMAAADMMELQTSMVAALQPGVLPAGTAVQPEPWYYHAGCAGKWGVVGGALVSIAYLS